MLGDLRGLSDTTSLALLQVTVDTITKFGNCILKIGVLSSGTDIWKLNDHDGHREDRRATVTPACWERSFIIRRSLNS
jgi:hypothetical protein